MEQVAKGVIADWTDRSTLGLTLTLWYALKDLTDREVLILWEGSTMDRAMRSLLPMFAHGFDERARDTEAVDQAGRLLARLRTEGLYC